MKRSILIVGLFITAALLLQGCAGFRTVRGTGDMTTEEREVSSFNALDLGTVGNVSIEVGEQEGLRIEAEENLLQYIETEVRGGTLHIETRQNVNILPSQPLFYIVTVTELESISVSGLGNVDAPELTSGNFAVNISGGGNIDIEGLEADELTVDISGVGDLNVAGGEVGQLAVTISGGGNHNSRELASNRATVDISGLGSATVWAQEHLDVEISGGGSVRYVGEPTVEQNVSGLGRVEQIGE